MTPKRSKPRKSTRAKNSTPDRSRSTSKSTATRTRTTSRANKATVKIVGNALPGHRGSFVALVEAVRRAAQAAEWTEAKVSKLHSAMIHAGSRESALKIANRYFTIVGAADRR